MTRDAQPVRVLYCESNSDGTIGGSHYCLLNLVEHLDRAKFEPVTLFLEEHALMPRFRAAGESIVADGGVPRIRWGTGRVAERFPVLGVLASVARRCANVVLMFAVVAVHVRFLRQHRIQLLHFNNSINRHHAMMVAAFILGIPCISHERGVSPSYSWLARAFARRLALIVPVSHWVKNDMVAGGVSAANIRVLYDGLDPNLLSASRRSEDVRREWCIAPGQPVVGIVGNVRAWKGQNVVARAMIDVVKTHPDAVCLFVGSSTPEDRPFADSLHRLVAEGGIERNVRFTGYQKDIPSLVNAMDVVVHASVLPEPFGMVVLEAMAQRKAVIGSRAGGVVEMVVEGETGYTFPPGNAAELAARIVELIENPARAQQMGVAGYRRLVTSFSLDRYMQQIQTAYSAILARRPVPASVNVPLQTGQS